MSNDSDGALQHIALGYLARAERAEAEVARLREALEDFAEHDCEYGDECPVFGSRHGACVVCRARRALATGEKGGAT